MTAFARDSLRLARAGRVATAATLPSRQELRTEKPITVRAHVELTQRPLGTVAWSAW